MLALSQDASRNRPVEAREHVRRFHELFFTIAPDKDAIEKNMERAFVLCDKSAFNYYKDLAEKGYYNRAISGNVNQRIEVDSIHCNFNTYPLCGNNLCKRVYCPSEQRYRAQSHNDLHAAELSPFGQ